MERLNEMKLVFGFYGSTLTLFLLHPNISVSMSYLFQLYLVF